VEIAIETRRRDRSTIDRSVEHSFNRMSFKSGALRSKGRTYNGIRRRFARCKKIPYLIHKFSQLQQYKGLHAKSAHGIRAPVKSVHLSTWKSVTANRFTFNMHLEDLNDIVIDNISRSRRRKAILSDLQISKTFYSLFSHHVKSVSDRVVRVLVTYRYDISIGMDFTEEDGVVKEQLEFLWFFLTIAVGVSAQFVRFDFKIPVPISRITKLCSTLLMILMPNCNKNRPIELAITSVLCQTVSDFEFIISVDKSDDCSSNILLIC
jgi:hypothetical protein